MKRLLLFGLTALVTVSSCQKSTGTDYGAADRILIGNVITMDKDSTVAQAVAFKDGKVLFVGSKEDAQKYRGKHTDLVNYGTASIYPGFMDGHTHGYLAAQRYMEADLSGINYTPGAQMSDFVTAMKNYMDSNPGRDMYKGSGWSIKNGVLPTAAMLDAICPKVPMLLNSGDGHSMWINTAAIEKFHINASWVEKYGADCVRKDADGKITGYISEAPAFVLIKATALSKEKCMEGLLKWQDYAFSRGITATTEAATNLGSGTASTAYVDLAASPLWKLRTYAVETISESVSDAKLDSALNKVLQLHQDNNGEYFQVTGVKVFVDGIVEAHTAWLKQEYSDEPGYYGLKRCSDPVRVAKIVEFANRNGMNVHFHCIGDGATALAVEGIVNGQNAASVKDGRNTIAHLQLVSPEDIQKMAGKHIIAVLAPQWAFLDQDEYSITEGYIGSDRVKTMFPVKSFVEARALINLHSDYPVSVPLSVQQNFCAAVSGRLELNGEVVFNRNEKELTERYPALQAVTINVAHQWGQDDRLGSLEVGKVANAVICDADFLKDDVEKILASRILETIVDGQTVYPFK